MTSPPAAPTWFEAMTGRVRLALGSCSRRVPRPRRRHRVHPLCADTAGRNRFLQLGPQRRIRVVHVDAGRLSSGDSLRGKQNGATESVPGGREGSEDDYWFTRWTQPLKMSTNCNCSFKRKRASLRVPARANGDANRDNVDAGIPSKRVPASCRTPRIDGDADAKRVYELRVDGADRPSPRDVKAFAAEFVRTVLEDAVTHVSLCAGSNEVFTATDASGGAGLVNPSFVPDPPPPTPPRCSHAARRARKPLLYFLHGVGGSADVWWGLLRFFVSAGYEVLAPDMLGHGYSSAPDRESAYTFQHLLKDAVDVFDRFVGDNGKCVVVGHSYGCSLAAAVARYRTQVSHLVLISGGGPTPLAPSQRPPMFPGLRGCVEAFLVCGFKRDALYAPCGKQMTSCATSGQRDVPQYVLRHTARGQDWPEGDSTFHRRILVPTLLVHGIRDTHVTLVQECEMERTIPRSFLELIPNAGHLAMLETPAQLSHMINCFIEWWSR